MAQIDDLEQARIERLITELISVLAAVDRVATPRLDDKQDRARWRLAARRAGRRLGLPTRTGVSRVDGAIVWAYVEHEGRRAWLMPVR